MTTSALRLTAPRTIHSIQRFAQQALAALEQDYPDASTKLVFSSRYQLLVATILSAQSTHKRVNQVTPGLFKQFQNADALSRANTSELQALIRSTGCFLVKARALVRMASKLIEHHRGEVPTSMNYLTALPGVGRKTANVLLGHAFNSQGFPVDRHVLRVSNRLGLVQTNSPTHAESELTKLFRKP